MLTIALSRLYALIPNCDEIAAKLFASAQRLAQGWALEIEKFTDLLGFCGFMFN